jgi:hypothetical protein
MEPEETVVKSRLARYPYSRRSPKAGMDKRKGVSNRMPNDPPAIMKSHGTRVIPVFLLSLAGVDPQLMMEGENLMWVSHDSVFVLQHAGDPIPLRSAFVLLFMSSYTSVLLSLSQWPSLHKSCTGKNQVINVGGY